MIETRVRPVAAALTRRLAARAARIAVEAVEMRRTTLPRTSRGLWPDLFKD